jgi:hypothetical protein
MVSEQAPAAEVVEGSDTAAPAPVESEEAAPKAEEQQKEDEAPVVVEDVKEGEDEDDDDDDDDDEADEGNVCACLLLPTLHAAECKVQNCRYICTCQTGTDFSCGVFGACR